MWWFPRQTIHRLFNEIYSAKTKPILSTSTQSCRSRRKRPTTKKWLASKEEIKVARQNFFPLQQFDYKSIPVKSTEGKFLLHDS